MYKYLLIGFFLIISNISIAKPIEKKILKIGVLSFENKDDTFNKWSPLALYLSDSIDNYSFEVVPLFYEDMNKAVCSGELDFIFTNPGHYIELKTIFELSGTIATLIEKNQGQIQYEFGGVIFVRGDNNKINNIKQLKNKRISAVSKNSLGGYQASAYELYKEGLNLNKISFEFTGMPHKNVVYSVLDGRNDAGFIRTGVLERMIHNGEISKDDIKIINIQESSRFKDFLSTELYPEWPFTATMNVEPEIARLVASALLMFSEVSEYTDKIGIYGFNIPSNYLVVEEMMRSLKLPPFDKENIVTLSEIWKNYKIYIAILAILVCLLISLIIVKFISEREIKRKNKILNELMKKLEKANRAKSEFLSNMSHEIRTPMNGIFGFVDLLLEIEDNKKKKEYLKIIKSSSEHLMTIINDILSISKIEAEKFESKERVTNLYDKFSFISKTYKIQSELKGLEFKLEIDKSLKRDIITDEYILLKTLNNLLSNSLNFTEKGYILLSVKEIENKKIEILIEDTGIGINEEKQKRLFEPFEQGEHYLTKQYGGTGLGLALVKRMIDILGGKIFVETQIGVGTRFKVTIPFKEVEKSIEQKKDVKQDLNINKKLRIISAEDVEINQKLLEKMVKREDIFFKKVYTGQELLDELEKENYDLILMDIQMPVVNGIEATKRIRSNKKYNDIPIIAISAYAFEEDIEDMKKAGISDCISKPIEKKIVVEKINKWTKKEDI